MPFEKASFPLSAPAPRPDEGAGQRGAGGANAGAPLGSSAPWNPRAGTRLPATRRVLVLGFGVLLALLILSGLSALHALSELQVSNETTLRQFLARNRQLDQIRTAVYLCGTYIRDYLLEPDRVKAEQSRRALIDAHLQIESLLADNGPLSGGADHEMFEALKREIQDYWQTLEPVLSWDLDQRRRQGYRFLRDEVLPGVRVPWASRIRSSP